MYNTVTSTNLKKHTSGVIEELENNPDTPIVVTKHDMPKAVMISYNKWLGIQSELGSKKLKSPEREYKTEKKGGKKKYRNLAERMLDGIGTHKIEEIDSTALIRKWRDDE